MSLPRTAFLLAALAAAAPALAQEANIATLTCAEAMAEGAALPGMHLPAALAGAIALRAGRTEVNLGLGPALREPLREACPQPANAQRTLIDLAAAVPAPADGPTIDLATLTCAALAPRWRQEARAIVPAIVVFLAGPGGRISRAAFDRVGEGLPRQCRDPANADRRVLELAAALP
ncbi:hypothetical protein [Roseomonas sp. CECT 9278]|uniref:hypothetical protein n=1 Tax=Roseomonas sp. CECT 9278 TaxID=2845823 RepID=UPI001E40544F|nr:hypothetical protein [Roseomonas sp. CECT 9278]CAH0179570.1 hypothetical protein ROS9278_01406 [Roseomonas sp. CECT 9278]